MVALLNLPTQDTLLSHLTTYQQSSMWRLRRVLERLCIGDMLVYRQFTLERCRLDSGYQHYRLQIGETLIGIVEVRGHIALVQQRLTAYLWWLGFRADNALLIEYGELASLDLAQHKAGVWICPKQRDMPKLFE